MTTTRREQIEMTTTGNIITNDHNFVPQDGYYLRLCGICGLSKSQHETPEPETWTHGGLDCSHENCPCNTPSTTPVNRDSYEIKGCPECRRIGGKHHHGCGLATPETQRAEQGSVDEGESSRAIDRARRSAERLADQRDTEQSEVEAGEWYFIKWYDVDLKAYPQEPKFAIEHKETLVAIALEQATAERIINDHRLAALVSQAETALEAITPRCDFVVDRDKSTRCGAVAVAEGSFGLKYCRDHKGDRDTVDAGVAVEAALSAIRKEREK
jgi:hypothetical protein